MVMLKRPQGPPNSPHHQRQQCQLRSLCRDRGVMLPCTSCAGVPTPPSPLQQDGHGPSSTILRCPCLLSLRAPWQHLPFGGQHHRSNSQPGLRTCITAPYSALAPASLEKPHCGQMYWACPQDAEAYPRGPVGRTHSQGTAAGSVQAQGCVSSLSGLCGGSSSSSHPPPNGFEILGQ